MHVLLGKKQIVLAALVAALGLAVFVNWYYTKSDTKIFDPVINNAEATRDADSADGEAEFVGNQEDEYFATIRLTRDSAHEAAVDELKAVLASGDSKVTGDTEKAIKELSEIRKMETDIESIVSGKLNSSCVAVISDSTVEVIVKPEKLSDENVLLISDSVGQVCGSRYENIKISGTVS